MAATKFNMNDPSTWGALFSSNNNTTTGATVTSGTGSDTVSTGKSAGFNIGMLSDLLNAGGNFLGSVITAIYTGKSIQAGTYYNRYNQGQYNSYNSGTTTIILLAGVAVIVILLKKA